LVRGTSAHSGSTFGWRTGAAGTAREHTVGRRLTGAAGTAREDTAVLRLLDKLCTAEKLPYSGEKSALQTFR
jgi:hypothetical protein